jgi:hypothetical protein
MLLGKEEDYRMEKLTEVEFQTRKEDWNEYQLMDGTVIKMKLVVSEIFRIEGAFDSEGNPAYRIMSTNVPVVKSPDALKRKP